MCYPLRYLCMVRMIRNRHMLAAFLFLALAFMDIITFAKANPSFIVERLHLDVPPCDVPSTST